jgi:hypothetical protein
MSGTYAAIYRRAREALEAEAEHRLERPLTRDERNIFRNCGTLTRLEELGMTIYTAESAADLSAALAATSMGSRFDLALDELVTRLKNILGRPVTPQERQQMRRLENIEALWLLENSLYDTPQPQRQAAFADILKQPSPSG